MEKPSSSQETVILHMDATRESQLVRDALKRANVQFAVTYCGIAATELPAIETVCGMISGFNNIRRYLLPDVLGTGAS
jgi:hypothetical protein